MMWGSPPISSTRAKQNSSGSGQGRAGRIRQGKLQPSAVLAPQGAGKGQLPAGAREAHRRAAPPDRLFLHAPASPAKKAACTLYAQAALLISVLLDLIGAAHEQLGRRRSRLDAAVGDRHHVKMVLRQAAPLSSVVPPVESMRPGLEGDTTDAVPTRSMTSQPIAP